MWCNKISRVPLQMTKLQEWPNSARHARCIQFKHFSFVISFADFSGYRCRCPDGYSGDYCETDIDECLSSPCPANYSCVNHIGRYECFCHPKWPCHVTAPLLQSWQVVLVSVGGSVFLVFLVLVVLSVFCRKT